MKRCIDCGDTKALDGFHRQSQKRDGRSPYCKDCAAVRARAKYLRHRDEIKARVAQYQRDNREEVVRKNRERRHRDPEAMRRGREASKRWKQNNREAWRKQKRRNARRGAVGRGPLEVAYADTLRRDPCSYCRGPGGHIDHIDAQDNGGPNHWSNLTAACPRCNSTKNTKPLLTYLLGA